MIKISDSTIEALKAIRADRWVVNVNKDEISVLRDYYEHGKRSYGWFGPDKILILSGNGMPRGSVHRLVWPKALKMAEEVAAELNAEEEK